MTYLCYHPSPSRARPYLYLDALNFVSVSARCFHHVTVFIMPPKLEAPNTQALADPNVQPPDAQLLEQATIGSLRSTQHLDINGNPISKVSRIVISPTLQLTTSQPTQISLTRHGLAWSARSIRSGRSRGPLTMATRGGIQ